MFIQQPYVIGTLHPLTSPELADIAASVIFTLPHDYPQFLSVYGYGNFNELLNIFEPDKDYVSENFGEYMDFWELSEEETRLILTGLTIGTTIDGDVIVLIDQATAPYVVLPRHSDKVIRLKTFQELLDYYGQRYTMNNNWYFDSNYNFKLQYQDFVRDGKMDKALFDEVFQLFLKEELFDRVYNEGVQPKYMLPQIGGWVYFDLAGKSAWRVKYQEQFANAAHAVINRLQEAMK